VLISQRDVPTPISGCQICTRSGWPIPELPDHPTEGIWGDREQWTNKWLRELVGVSVRSWSTYPYNCMGMVFAARRSAIDPKHVYRILRDDEYRRIGVDELSIGDVVVYELLGTPSHVGIIAEIRRSGPLSTPFVISKWGDILPEFIHPVDQVPDLLGNPTGYFTDRPLV